MKNKHGLPLEQCFILNKGKPEYVNTWKDHPVKSPGRTHQFSKRSRDGSVGMREYTQDKKWATRRNIWYYAVGLHSAKEKYIRKAKHGAYMPERMAEDLILAYSRPGALVFDPFSGLATTAKMAYLNFRQFMGMEIDKDFHELGVRRLKDAKTLYDERLMKVLTAKT